MPTRTQKLALKQQLAGLTDKEWGQFSDSELSRIEFILQAPDDMEGPMAGWEEFRAPGGPASVFDQRAITPQRERQEGFPTVETRGRYSWTEPRTIGPALVDARTNAWESLKETGREAGRMVGMFGDEENPAGRDLWKLLAQAGLRAATQPPLMVALDLAKSMYTGSEPVTEINRLGSGIKKSFELDEIARHPFGALATAATMAQPAVRAVTLGTTAGRTAPRLGSVLRGATAAASDPWQALAGVAAKGLGSGWKTAKAAGIPQGIGKTAGVALTEMAGFAQGKSGEAIRTVAETAYDTPRGGAIAQSAIRKTGSTQMGSQVVKGFERKYQILGEELNQILGDLKTRNVQLPTDQLKFKLFGDIDQDGAGGILHDMFRIKVRRAPGAGPGSKKAFVVRTGQGSGLVRLKFPGYIRKTSDAANIQEIAQDIGILEVNTPVQVLDDLKRGLTSRTASTPEIGKAYKAIGEVVREPLLAIPEYAAQMEKFKQFFRETKGLSGKIDTDLHVSGLEDVKSRTKREIQIGRRLGHAFSSESTSGQKASGEALEELARMFPKKSLVAKAAGQQFASWQPSGLVGRGQLAQSLPRLLVGTGGFLSMGLLGLALTLPMYSPQATARIAIQAGIGARKAMALQKRMDVLAAKASKAGVSGMKGVTIGEVLQRSGITMEELLQDLDEEEK